MVSDRELSHVVGGKSARACDNCVRKRARWYCTADDAFLCESCDSSVHSANPLARRHERVRLKTASAAESSGGRSEEGLKVCVPSWHEGFKKKARTPRRKKRGDPLRLVPEPELCSEEESEEQLLYRVPIFEPFKTDLETSFENYGEKMKKESKVEEDDFSDEMNRHLEGIILPSELDIAEFAADVESLLGKGLDEEAFAMEGLGILDCEAKECGRIAKDEDEDTGEGDGNCQIDVGREIFEMNFDSIAYEEEHKIESIWRSEHELDDSSKAFLKLNYDKVMSAWDEKKSPWTTGERPEFTYDEDWWRDCCLGTSGAMHAYGGVALGSGQAAVMGGGGREARVSRYREKRRTRLFSKKIRYEVRKLNAEKRPRMKGRFVKRASVAASAFPLLGK